jgi:thiol:disulfide interchange protein DsbD
MTALFTSLRKVAARLPSLALLLVPLLGSGAAALAADDEFLEPEKAFQFSARAADDRTLEVIYQIAPGYYLYREQFKFSAQGASLGSAEVPAGKIKFDETFQKNVETHRGEIRIRLPVTQAAGLFELNVVSQGCADAGLCYPPMTSTARASLVGFGGDGLVKVQLAQPTASLSPVTAALVPAAARVNTTSWVDGAAVERVLKSGRFWLVIGGFFVFGLLLSLTPCVLPMLPIVSSIIAGGGGTPARSRSLLLATSYSLGMAAVYTALGIAAGLAGEGLAAALQKPWVLAAFALLLATLSLSMFDLYELRLPAAWTHAMGNTSNRLPAGRLAGVFVMGGVSALIVSPCVTAPLAGALVFIGQSRDVVLGGAALFAQAAGMSVPLLLIGASAGAWLPRGGAWMVGIKRLFGLMLLAVAIWVVQPVLPNAAALALWGALLLLTGLLLRPFAKRVSASGAAMRNGLLRSALGLVAIAIGIVQWVGAATGANDPLQPLARLSWLKPDTAATVAAPQFRVVRTIGELDALLRQTDRPVMLDFYADWCVSCKEMERFTFTDPAVAAMMSNALLLKADVTANNAGDKALLKRFNLFGPPGTIFFDTQGRELAGLRVIGFQDAGVFRRTLVSAGLCTREPVTATC